MIDIATWSPEDRTKYNDLCEKHGLNPDDKTCILVYGEVMSMVRERLDAVDEKIENLEVVIDDLQDKFSRLSGEDVDDDDYEEDEFDDDDDDDWDDDEEEEWDNDWEDDDEED